MSIKKRMFILTITALLCLAGSIPASGSNPVKKIIKDLPDIHTLETYTPSQVTKIYDYRGNVITELFTERRTLIPLKDIPADLQNAVIATEDSDFYGHWGISVKGIARAALNNLVKRRVAQGGSTITQQLAKTIFLTPDRTMERKVKELVLTLQIERGYTKSEILQLYLNQIYFGAGAYGVESAARIYFSKHVKDLNLAECALLAGLPRAPNYYSPFANVERAKTRRAVVLMRMREMKFITPEQEKAANEVLISTKKSSIPTDIAPYFIEFVRLQLEPKYGTHMIYRGGLSIYTTLDLKAQRSAEQAMFKALDAYDVARASAAIASGGKASRSRVQGALLAIDPKTGGIRAMVGGRDFRESQFNRAVQARRQPGSSFKPVIFTAALENGFSPATVIEDKPMIFLNDGKDWKLESRDPGFLKTLPAEMLKDPMKVWMPENYGRKYHDRVLMRSALEHSLNVCSIEILSRIGVAKVIEFARRMGIESPLTGTLSLALGSSDVTLIEMVSAFSVLDSGGIRTRPYAVIRVLDKNGKALEENLPVEQEALSAQTCYVMTSMMRGVVERGTGAAARALGRPCAGKTGTTNDYSDAWFIGYTPQLVAGVWIGFDTRMSLGEKMTGGRLACPIWTEFMSGALNGEPVLNFNSPGDVVFTLIDPRTGLLALSKTPGAFLESFVKGTEPKDYYPQEEVPEDRKVNEIPGDEEGF